MTALDLFAGPGGWDEALAALGVPDVIGIELDVAACATAETAGHKRLRADVAEVSLPHFCHRFGPVTGLVASPPCPSFSTAGKGLGKLDAPHILAHIDNVRRAGCWLPYGVQWHDPRSALVLEPLRYALTLRPDWIALEQVPPVLPIWQAMAEVLRDHGYHVETGWLTAEQYGVPQTRKRAILAARRCAVPAGFGLCGSSVCVKSKRTLLPAPTHRKYRKGMAQREGDPALLPWVSMADALGWPELVMRSNYGSDGDPKARGERTSDEPSPTVTGRIDRNKLALRQSSQANATVRRLDGPAPTITAAHDRAERQWVLRAFTYSNQGTLAEQRHAAQQRLADEPAPTITSKGADYTWADAESPRPVPTRDVERWRTWLAERGRESELVHIGGDRWGLVGWVDLDKPATTVQDDPRTGGHDSTVGLTGGQLAAVRVSVQEAAVLQSFRSDYPWQGSRTAQYQQVGNAIPPLLAQAVLRSLIGSA